MRLLKLSSRRKDKLSKRRSGENEAQIGALMALLILALEHVVDFRIRKRKNN
jgi:hypothetical protein